MELEQRIEDFIAHWRETGGSELANTQSFINGLCSLLGVQPPNGSKIDDQANDYVFERRVFQDNGDGTQSFGRIDAYKRNCFILEAKQGSEGDKAALKNGDEDLDLFGQTASVRVKRGTAKRGTPSWAKAMIQAKGQAERYAKALPLEHGWPPILLVTDIGFCIEVFADFSGTGKAYAQFPDRARYRIMLDDLRDPDVRKRLKAIWEDPKSLDPAATSAKVTRKIADLLATVAKRIEARGHSAEQTSGFLMRVLFTFFAEDCDLIPIGSFTKLLLEQRGQPTYLKMQLEALWATMDQGGFSPALGVPLKKFNGYLFKARTAILLDSHEIDVLIEAGNHEWTQVEPAIFGTLLERALNPNERAKLGAHYTPRAYVERLIGPTIMEPLRNDWDGVRVAAAALIDDRKDEEARAFVERFHAKFAQIKILDPACGTGNFLYVAMARMKELEGEIVDLLVELGHKQYLADLSGHTITPENFLGIEINPRAAEIAQLVLWIGYLQWHFRVHGIGRAPPEPILRDVRTIENRDALIVYDDKVLERDDEGQPVTIWDGISYKIHPVSGKLVPDDSGRLELYRYMNPRETSWPKADFIVGNPPFIGNKRMRARLGDGYTAAVRKAYPKVKDSVDFVMYWWWKAARALGKSKSKRFGFITTNSIAQISNRSVIEKASARIIFAIADHPWVDSNDGASVRIAFTCGSLDRGQPLFYEVQEETELHNGTGEVAVKLLEQKAELINPDLSIGAATSAAFQLRSNRSLSFMGVIPKADAFHIDEAQANQFGLSIDDPNPVLRRYLNGSDLADNKPPRLILDFFGYSEDQIRERSPAVYQHLLTQMKDERVAKVGVTADSKSYGKNWWTYVRARPEMRQALYGLSRYIGTVETSKFRWFTFLDAAILPDQKIRVIASESDYDLGVLSSKIHVIWALATGGLVGPTPTYTNTTCFEPFPFPLRPSAEKAIEIGRQAQLLESVRKDALSANPDLTYTNLYNVLEALRMGRLLSAKERDIHDRGLVSLIREHHDAIDALVAKAYCWPADLSDEEILTRLVALNKERAAEEANGLVHWLRPEYQSPHYVPPAQSLDLGDTPAILPDNIIPWPGTLPEQVSAVQSVLSNASLPLAAQDVARAFKNKRASTVKPVLDALAGIGMARRLSDGRYAA